MCMYMFLCMCRYLFVKINVFLLCAWIKCMDQNTINLLTKEKCYHYDFIFFSVFEFIFVTLFLNLSLLRLFYSTDVFLSYVINKQIIIHATKYLGLLNSHHCQIDMFRVLKNIQSRLFYNEIVINSHCGPFFY